MNTQERLEAHFATSIYHWEILPLQVPLSEWDDPLKRELYLCQQARYGRHHVSDERSTGNTQIVWFSKRRKKK